MFDSVKTAFGRRDLFRRGGLLAAAQALLGGSRPAHAAAARNGRQTPPRAGYLPIDRRPSADQLPRYPDRHQRFAGTAGGAGGGGCRWTAPRGPGRADGRRGAPPGRTDGRRVGSRVLGLRGRHGAHHRGMRHRRESRPARSHSRPDGIRQGRGGDSERLAQRIRSGNPLGGRAHHRSGRCCGIRSCARSEGGDGLYHERQSYGATVHSLTTPSTALPRRKISRCSPTLRPRC